MTLLWVANFCQPINRGPSLSSRSCLAKLFAENPKTTFQKNQSNCLLWDGKSIFIRPRYYDLSSASLMPTYLNLNLSSDYSKCSDGPDAFPANSFDHKGSVAFGPNKVGGCQFWRCLLLKPLPYDEKRKSYIYVWLFLISILMRMMMLDKMCLWPRVIS